MGLILKQVTGGVDAYRPDVAVLMAQEIQKLNYQSSLTLL